MAKFIFIPSCEVAPIDSLDNTLTLKRLKKGLKLWKKLQCKIIVSGGIYLPPNTQTVPSGLLMKNWLIQKGVPENMILAETNSRDTYENIHGIMEMISNDTNSKIIVVSHWQHCLRIFITFIRNYKIKVKTVPMFYWIGVKGFILEWLICLIHIMDKSGNGKISIKNRDNRTFSYPNTQ